MKIKKFEFNPFPVNTYIVWDEDTHECIVIDAGCYYPKEKETLSEYIRDNALTVKHLLATHLHLDHNFGNTFASHEFGIPLEADKADEFLLAGMREQAAMFGMELPDSPVSIGRYIKNKDTFTFGKHTLHAISVPGHSPGSLVFYEPDERVAFAGDVLFRGSIGRTDLPGGSYVQLINGIKQKLLVLPDDTIIYPGHGPKTTIGYEKENNPYF